MVMEFPTDDVKISSKYMHASLTCKKSKIFESMKIRFLEIISSVLYVLFDQ